MSAVNQLGFYLRSKTRSPWRYALGERCCLGPRHRGHRPRAIAYKVVLKADGLCHRGPRAPRSLRGHPHQPIRVSTTGCPFTAAGRPGDGSWLMAGAAFVFNFRGISRAGIRIGRRTFLGETLMRGRGGITVGDNVLFAPRVQVLAVDHVMAHPKAHHGSGHHRPRHRHRGRLLDQGGRGGARRRDHRARHRGHRRRRDGVGSALAVGVRARIGTCATIRSRLPFDRLLRGMDELRA